MGRPPKEINGEWVSRLAAYGLTQREIAEVFDCDQSTISKRFASEFATARGQWKMSIRRAQTRRAVRDGSDAMLIHLGKSVLGQNEKIQVTTKEQPRFIDRAHNPRDKPIEHAGSNGHTNGSVAP